AQGRGGATPPELQILRDQSMISVSSMAWPKNVATVVQRCLALPSPLTPPSTGATHATLATRVATNTEEHRKPKAACFKGRLLQSVADPASENAVRRFGAPAFRAHEIRGLVRLPQRLPCLIAAAITARSGWPGKTC